MMEAPSSMDCPRTSSCRPLFLAVISYPPVTGLMRNVWLSPPQHAHCCIRASAAVEMPETSRHFPLLLEMTVIQEDGILTAALPAGAGLLLEGSRSAGATLMGEAGALRGVAGALRGVAGALRGVA